MKLKTRTHGTHVNFKPKRIAPRLIGGLAGLAFLTACQSQPGPVVSMSEAKKISTEFKGTSYQQAPRAVADIEALLDEISLTNWDRVEADRQIADVPAPAAASPAELAEFFRDRAKRHIR